MKFFTNFYNRVSGFFKPQENTDENNKDVARSRLKLVLMQDRTNLTPKILEQMRGELVDLLSKYVELDKNLLELNFEQEGDQVALMLSIPVIRARDEKEIEETLKKEALLKGIHLAEDVEEDEKEEDEGSEIEEGSEKSKNSDSEETLDESGSETTVTSEKDDEVENSEQSSVEC